MVYLLKRGGFSMATLNNQRVSFNEIGRSHFSIQLIQETKLSQGRAGGGRGANHVFRWQMLQNLHIPCGWWLMVWWLGLLNLCLNLWKNHHKRMYHDYHGSNSEMMLVWWGYTPGSVSFCLQSSQLISNKDVCFIRNPGSYQLACEF
jgi:hypothetical protein